MSPMAAWVAYGLVVGLLLAAVAAIGEPILRTGGRPVRWVWALALGLTVVLIITAPQRVDRQTVLAVSPGGASVGLTAPAPALAWRERAMAGAAAVARALGEPLRWTVSAAGRALPGRVDRWLIIAWIGASATLCLLFGVVYARFARARARWPQARLQGTLVRVAPGAGPAVVGLVRPEIIVPDWLLERSNDEQRVILVHEREHVVARDPLLLAAACVAAVIVPWHPAVWWMLSRLRLAVELDCDRRVLRRGIGAQSYGLLLIDLAGRCSGLRIGAPALADESSHLQQRLVAMTLRTSRLSPARYALTAAIAGVALLAACEAKLPTQTQVNDMTAASAATVARQSALLPQDTADAQYTVNGATVSAGEANAIAPEQIASVEVTKGPSAPNGKGLVAITTRRPGAAAAPQGEQRIRIITTPNGNSTTVEGNGMAPRQFDNFAGVVLVDGVRVTEAAMQAIPPADIVSVEVIKGQSAAELYAAPEAKNGVIRITTKKGAKK